MSTLSNRLWCGVSILAVSLSLFFVPAVAAERKKEELSITITQGNLIKSDTVPTVQAATRAINQTPGGVEVVPFQDIEKKYIQNFQDTLSFVPGVYAQKRFGEEVRLSIRGSGISRGFHMRGITLLQDGIPFNLADGAGDFQEADPLALQHIEVYKGGNALAYGGNSLGGAINLVSPTGYTARGNQVRVEAGSENTYRTNVRTGHVFGNQDVFLSLTTTDSNGFRQHSDQSNVKLNTNYGIKLNDNSETRFYLSGNMIEQELPGSLSRFDALNNPDKANPAQVNGDQKRDIRSLRLANKTAYKISGTQTLEGGVFMNLKDLFHPIFAVVDQETMDYGGFGTLKGSYALGDYQNRYRLGFTAQAGTVDALLYTNVRGNRGALMGDADQKASTYNAFAENHFYVTPTVALVTGGQLTWAARESFNNLSASNSDDRIYQSFNPKLGVLYEHVAGNQFFANISKSNEAPTFTELTQGGTTGFTPVNAQAAWTAEIGTRGHHSRYSWNVSVYRSWVKDEMLQYTTGAGIPASTFNADRTIHQGLELGFDVALSETVKWQNAYTYSDFTFQGDRQYGDNQLAGVPEHFYKTAVRYTDPTGWNVAPNLEWVPTGAEVDFANTLDAKGYALLGVEAGYDLNERVSLFVDARNLTNEKYISNFSTITRATPANSSVFYPGEGISAFAGMIVRF
jgi:iron complex outermembrane receptor protein